MTTGIGGSRERANAAGTEESDQRGDVPSDTFSLRLVIVRHHAGRLSIEQAAVGAGINPEAWRRWEDGARPRDRIEASQQISEAYGINLDWLLFGGALVPARGRPTRRVTKRTNVDTTWNRPVTAGPGAGTTRPGTGRPKGRTDQLRPISPPGRRAEYLNGALGTDSRHVA